MGAGGGIVKGPLMLEMGVLPAVSVNLETYRNCNQAHNLDCTVSHGCLHDPLHSCLCIHLFCCVWNAPVSCCSDRLALLTSSLQDGLRSSVVYYGVRLHLCWADSYRLRGQEIQQ